MRKVHMDIRKFGFSPTRSHLFIDKQFPKNNTIGSISKFSHIIPACITLCFTRIAFWLYFGVSILFYYYTMPLSLEVVLVPILIMFFSSVFIEIVSSIRMHKLLGRIDRHKVRTLRDGEWVDLPWRAVAVGDIIELCNGDVSPADVILLGTGDSRPCFMDTHIIDGSKILKPKVPLLVKCCHPMKPQVKVSYCPFTNPKKFQNYPIEIECPKPPRAPSIIKKIELRGKAICDSNLLPPSESSSPTFEIPLSPQQFIERYSAIYHSSPVYCIAAYTGSDCRTYRQQFRLFRNQLKYTKLESMLNIICAILIIIYFIFVAASAGMATFYSFPTTQWPFHFHMGTIECFVDNFIRYTVLYLPIVPLEIYPAIDLILFIHSLFIQHQGGTVALIAPIEELAHVNSVITSKANLVSGSVTPMRLMIGGQVYGQSLTTSQISHETIHSYDSDAFIDSRLDSTEETDFFFRCLTICTAASPVKNGQEIVGYQSVYPEDEPLHRLCGQFGFVLVNRIRQNVSIIVKGEFQENYITLCTEHCSARHPRLSMIVCDPGQRDFFLLTRGDVDSMRDVVSVPIHEEDEFKGIGLRVSCLAMKRLENFRQEMLLSVRTPQERTELFRTLEKNSSLLGLVAFQQEPLSGALSLVSSIKQAGIQLVLTSAYSAVSSVITGLSLGMLEKDGRVGTIAGSDKESVASCCASLHRQQGGFETLIIEGSSIQYLLGNHDAISLVRSHKTVILEKAGPEEAACFAQFLKKECWDTVMGIGQSVYDRLYLDNTSLSVSIREDDIQPCDAVCDICTHSLEGVRRMLLVDGGWMRERVSSFVTFILPRDVIFGLTYFIYGFHSLFTGTALYEENQTMLFLYLYTMLPAISRAVFNQAQGAKILLVNPRHYRMERKRAPIVFKSLIGLLLSILAAASLFFTTMAVMKEGRLPAGDSLSIPQFAFCLLSGLVLCSVAFLAPGCDSWPIVHHVICWGCPILFFLITRLNTNGEESMQWRGTVESMTGTNDFWHLMLILVGLSVYIMFSVLMWKNRRKIPRQLESNAGNEEIDGTSLDQSLLESMENVSEVVELVSNRNGTMSV